MNKSDLISAMAAEAQMSKADAKKALDAFITSVTNAMKAGDKVSLVGFGTFSVSERAERTGIIKSYSYAMTSFILKDEPEMKNNAAIEKSMAMMEGNKMKLFMLDLSFIGWAILCIFTLGIGLLFLQPYVAISRAAFYEDLKAQQGGSVEVNVEVNVEI